MKFVPHVCVFCEVEIKWDGAGSTHSKLGSIWGPVQF